MTLVSHRAEFVFLKTHKTGSTSVEAALEHLCLPEGAASGDHYRDMSVTEAGIVGGRGADGRGGEWRNHMSARTVRRKLGLLRWRRYLKFAVVRNPFDRAVSYFHYQQPPAEQARLAEVSPGELRDAFAHWLRNADLTKNRNKLTIGPRYCLDHVLYYETLDADVAAIIERFGGSPTPLPRYKAALHPRPAFAEHYDATTHAMVERACAFELSFFGYDIDGGPFRRPISARLKGLMLGDPLRLFNAFRTPRRRA